MSRFYYYVVQSGHAWEIKFEGQTQPYSYATQAEAISAATEAAKAMWQRGNRSGIRVQGANNQWRDERTYGEDPFPPPG
jgi:hypothetical protein